METLIQLKNVSKLYKKQTVLENVHTTFQKGETVAIVGKNGAGKSTLLKILGGLIKPTKGSVTIDSCVGLPAFVVEQFPQELPFRLQDYLFHMGRIQQISKKKLLLKIEELLETFDMTEYKYEEITSFSKGMKQKVNMMQAMLGSSELLLLDEPLSGLDAKAQVDVEKAFRRLKDRGMTIIFTCHEERLIQVTADRVITIGAQKILRSQRIESIDSLAVIEADFIINKPIRELKGKCAKVEQHGSRYTLYIKKQDMNQLLKELIEVRADIHRIEIIEREDY